ncbi:MAG: hypothetical protein BYD32DRAFT_418967 [Podila humilis]|nr:MAG: hypothetical protein BYD32DRAFT_418967 [Podila humilis]
MVSLVVVDGRITYSVPYFEPDHKAVIDSKYIQIQRINQHISCAGIYCVEEERQGIFTYTYTHIHIHVRTTNTSTSEKFSIPLLFRCF